MALECIEFDQVWYIFLWHFPQSWLGEKTASEIPFSLVKDEEERIIRRKTKGIKIMNFFIKNSLEFDKKKVDFLSYLIFLSLLIFVSKKYFFNIKSSLVLSIRKTTILVLFLLLHIDGQLTLGF